MAYCTEQDLKDRFGAEEIDGLIDRDADDQPDANALSSAISDADAMINGYLTAKYSTPIDPVPDLIRLIACNIVHYILYGVKAPDEIRKKYDDALYQLKDISKGFIVFPADETTPSESVEIQYNKTNRVFSMQSLSGF